MGFGAREIAKRHYAAYLPPPSREEEEDISWAEGLWQDGLSITAIAAETGLPIERLQKQFTTVDT